MLALLQKDFKLIFSGGKVGNWRAVTYILNVLLVGMFIAVETVVVSGVLDKVRDSVEAQHAILAVALFAISVLMTLICLVQAKKLFFNDKDLGNLTMMPIRNSQIILSKLFFLFLFQYVMGLLLTYPILACYAAMFNKGTTLFYLALFYPLLAFPFECGVALILMYPFKLLGDFLKRHPLVQFVVAMVVMLGMCWLYSKVLDVFISLVAGGNFNVILSAQNIAALVRARRFMLPTTWLVGIFIENHVRTVLIMLCVSIGVFILGVAACVISFGYLRNLRFSFAKPKKPVYKPLSATKTLVKKEFILLFRDSGNLFSFTGLLVAQPFLVYLIVSSVNTIFTTGVFAYYVSFLPTFLPIIDTLIAVLAGLIIAQGANSYIANESRNIRLIKTLPVDAFTQLAIKIGLPLAFVLLSGLATFVVLLAFGTIGAGTAAFGFAMTALIQAIFSLISMYEELRVRHNSPRNYFLSSTFSYLIPILYSAVMIVAAYFGLKVYVAYIIGPAVIIASGIPFAVRLKRRMENLFGELEVVN